MTKPPPPWWKKLLRLLAFALVALVTLTVLVVSWTSFQGRRDWARTKADLVGRGEKLSFVEIMPAPIPDERNVFGGTMWRELTDMVEKPAAENGARIKEPRLPKGQRQLDAFDRPVDAALIERARPLLHGPNQSRLAQPRLMSFLFGVTAELAAASDPSARRALGQLTIDSLQPVQPLLDRMRLEMHRPEARLPIDETEGFDPFSRTTIVGYVLTLGQVFQAESRAFLALGQTAASAELIFDLLRLSQAAGSDPSLISFLVGTSITSMPPSIITQGITNHQWSAAQLRGFIAALAAVDLRKSAAHALRGERGNTNQFYESLHARNANPDHPAAPFLEAGGKSPWQRARAYWNLSQTFSPANQAAFNRFFQSYIDACEAPSGLRPAEMAAIPQRTAASFSGFGKALVKPAIDSISQAFVNLARAQSRLIMVSVACALEQYWLENKTYPISLEALVPDFLPKIPSDIIAGEPLRYRLVDAGHFQLWSVGWNGIDEKGAPGVSPKDMKTGDWTWNRP